MSHHYSASQYDEPFRPIRLNNYSPFTNMTKIPYGVHAMCLPTHCSTTKIIADETGTLFDCIPRGPSSPWGDYATSIWEDTYDCCCLPQIRHPKKYCCSPQRRVFVQKEKPKGQGQGRPGEYFVPCICRIFGPPQMGGGGAAGAGGDSNSNKPKLTPLEKKMRQMEVKKQNREKRKAEQVLRKQQIDMKRYKMRIRASDRASTPPRHMDWNAVRHKSFKKKKHEHTCPPLESCCCDQQPGQWVTCPKLNQNMYLYPARD